jgi:hypothetical protein
MSGPFFPLAGRLLDADAQQHIFPFRIFAAGQQIIGLAMLDRSDKIVDGAAKPSRRTEMRMRGERAVGVERKGQCRYGWIGGLCGALTKKDCGRYLRAERRVPTLADPGIDRLSTKRDRIIARQLAGFAS